MKRKLVNYIIAVHVYQIRSDVKKSTHLRTTSVTPLAGPPPPPFSLRPSEAKPQICHWPQISTCINDECLFLHL